MFMGWNDRGPASIGFDVSARDVSEKGSQSGGRRWGLREQPAPFGGRKPSGQQTDCCTLDVALDTRDLAGETQARVRAKPQQPVEQPGTVEERVAMQAAEAGKLCALQPGDGAEDAGLLAMSQLGLEADDVPQGAERIVLAKLDDRIRARRAGGGIGEADRLHGSEAKGIAAALGHHLDGQAAVEIGCRRLPLVERGLFARQQRIDEPMVLLPRHGAIEIIGACAAGARLVVARLLPGDGEIDAVEMDDRGNRIEKGELGFARQGLQGAS